jgi:hypothetical protein
MGMFVETKSKEQTKDDPTCKPDQHPEPSPPTNVSHGEHAITSKSGRD